MRRPSLVILAALLLVISCGNQAFGAAHTQRLKYSPFAGDGSAKRGLSITPHYGGECNSGSWVVAGDTYRCFDGNFIRDPCYYDRAASDTYGEDIVLCVGSPWSHSAIRLRADMLDSSYGKKPGGPPWALQLADGQRCIFAEGATNVVGGLRLNYICSRDDYLFGAPDTSRALWRIRMSHSYTGAGIRKVAVRVAWR